MTKRKSSKTRKTKSFANKIQIKSNGPNQNHNLCCLCGCTTSRGAGWLFLILGLLYLFKDLGFFPWWTVSWWTILFLIVGYLSLKKT